MKKKFIIFIYNYHQLLFIFDKEANYYFGPCEAMLELGYDIEIITYGTNIKIEDDPNYNNQFKVIYFYNIFSLIKYIWLNKNSIIYSNTFTIPSLLIGFIGKKTVFFSHDPVLPTRYSKGYFFKKIFVKFCYRFFTKIRVINNYESTLLKSEGIFNKDIVIPLVVPSNLLNTKIKNNNNILLLGRVSFKKDPVTIIKALNIVIKKYPNIKIYQVGDYLEYKTEEGLNYKELVSKYGLNNNIILLGRLPVKTLDIDTSIYINSSLVEGQCMAVYDSILLGNAVCLANISSFQGVFGGNALMHELHDYKKLAENIIWYIENPELKEKHIKANQKYILDNLNYQTIKNNIQETFSNL